MGENLEFLFRDDSVSVVNHVFFRLIFIVFEALPLFPAPSFSGSCYLSFTWSHYLSFWCYDLLLWELLCGVKRPKDNGFMGSLSNRSWQKFQEQYYFHTEAARKMCYKKERWVWEERTCHLNVSVVSWGKSLLNLSWELKVCHELMISPQFSRNSWTEVQFHSMYLSEHLSHYQ